MATQIQIDRVQYPLMAYNFRVTISGQTMSFSEVSGLGREYETVTYRHGLSAWQGESIAVYHVDKYAPVTLKRGTMASGDLFVYHWFERRDTRSMTISLCDEHAAPVITWQVARTVPVKLTPPSFTADGNEVSIDTLEVMAAGVTINL